MNIKKLLLPLTFLGLSPTARANNQTHTNDSLPQHKITHTVDTTKTKQRKTIKFEDAQTEDEIIEIQRMLINGYNAKPQAYRIDNIIKLLTIADNGKEIYRDLRLSLAHAAYFKKNITPELQKKLGIKEKEDILFKAVNNHIYEMSDTTAFEFVATHTNLNKLKNPSITLTKALNVALADLSIIGKSPTHINCISNIMNFALSHQNDKKITQLYSQIFVTTAHMIRDYNQTDSIQNSYISTINALTKKIETFNTHIVTGSVLDSELQIKKPQDYVIQEYKNISYRVNKALIYNKAYAHFMSRTHLLRQKIYKTQSTQNLYQDYVDAIEIQYLIRVKSATEEQKQKLKKLIAAHPEIKLFEPYFCAVYLNTSEHNKILNFIVKVHTSKTNKAITAPKGLFTVLAKCNANAIPQQKYINQHKINVPNIPLKLPKKLTWSQIKKTVLISKNIEALINQSLNKQLEDLDLQIQSMQRLTIKNNLTINADQAR